MSSFRALVLEEKDGKVSSALQTVDETALPAGDVTIAVSHSTLNYKDGLILAGLGRIVRKYPHVPGIISPAPSSIPPRRPSRRATKSSSPAGAWVNGIGAATPRRPG